MNKLEMPFQVGWDIIHNCNLRCKHCYLSSKQLSDKTSFSKEEALKFIKYIADKKVFHLSIAGGEPMLYPHLAEVIHEATSNGMLVAMSSNAMLLTDQLAKKLKNAGLTSLQISLDGATEYVNDFIRGKGTYEKTINGIKIAKENGFKILIAFVLLKTNYHELEDIFKLSIKLGAYGVKIQTFIETGLGENNKEELLIDENTLGKVIYDGWQIKPLYQDKLEIMLPLIPEVVVNSKEAPEYFYKKSSCLGCQPGLTTVRVNSHGDVRACGGMNNDDQNVGNVKMTPLEDIYKNSQDLIRWRNESKVLNGEETTSCGTICGKGCRSSTAPEFAK